MVQPVRWNGVVMALPIGMLHWIRLKFVIRGHCSPNQPSATRPLFFDNLHFGQIAKSVNLDWWLTLLAVCPKGDCRKKGDELPTTAPNDDLERLNKALRVRF